MARIVLIHWNAEEARERASRLRAAGHRVVEHSDSEGGGAALRPHLRRPPDLFVIDLARLPSHGRACAVWFRQQKATRAVPIVFVEGDPEKTARVRELLPDAVYTSWGRIRSALRTAAKPRTGEPVVPGTMQGYSGTPLPRKLGIKAGTRVALLGAPADFERTLGALPEGVRVTRQARGRADRVLLFAGSRSELSRRFAGAVRTLADGGGLWIAWPKKSSGRATDLDQATVRRWGLDRGLVDYKIAALDETWSGLQFTRRRKPGRGAR